MSAPYGCPVCCHLMPCGCCRRYQGGATPLGYGRVAFGPARVIDGARRGRRTVLLHRWVMERLVGRRLAADEVVMHLCDTPSCFRVDHLRIGTHAENVADMVAKGRQGYGVSRGSASSQAKLTESDVAEIRRLRARGWKSHQIGERFGVSAACVRDAWNPKRSWQHVPA